MTEPRMIAHRVISELPAVIDTRGFDFDFAATHSGMSRAEWDEHMERQRREDAEAAVIESIAGGEPPADLDVDTKRLPEHRARFAKYKAWLDRTEADLTALEAERDRLNGFISAPTHTQGRIADLIKRGARALLGRASVDDDVAERARLDAELAAQKHRADTAHEALISINDQIALKQRQLARLRERQPSFLQPVILEEADRLRDDYLAAAAQLRRVLNELWAAREAAGVYVKHEVIKLPDFWPRPVRHDEPMGGSVRVVLRPGDSTVSWINSPDLTIARESKAGQRWKDWSSKLLTDPTTKATP